MKLAPYPLGMQPASCPASQPMMHPKLTTTFSPPCRSWPSAFLDHRAGALGFALMKTGGALGGFCGPFLVGAMADAFHGYGAAMSALAGVAAAAAALVYGELMPCSCSMHAGCFL